MAKPICWVKNVQLKGKVEVELKFEIIYFFLLSMYLLTFYQHIKHTHTHTHTQNKNTKYSIVDTY